MPRGRADHGVVNGRSAQHLWLVRLVLGIPLLWLALGLSLESDPRGFGTHEQLGLPPCQVREWLGVSCPTCGVTTAALLLLHGQPTESWHTQPFGFLLVLGSLVLCLQILRVHQRGDDAFAMLMERGGRRWGGVFLFSLFLGWAWRLLVWG